MVVIDPTPQPARRCPTPYGLTSLLSSHVPGATGHRATILDSPTVLLDPLTRSAVRWPYLRVKTAPAGAPRPVPAGDPLPQRRPPRRHRCPIAPSSPGAPPRASPPAGPRQDPRPRMIPQQRPTLQAQPLPPHRCAIDSPRAAGPSTVLRMPYRGVVTRPHHHPAPAGWQAPGGSTSTR